jgi:hypothetical protein
MPADVQMFQMFRKKVRLNYVRVILMRPAPFTSLFRENRSEGR